MAEFEIIDSPQTAYLYATRTAPMGGPEIGEKMGAALMEVYDFMTKNGITPAGPAIAVYTDYTPGPSEFRAGFIVADADRSKASGSVKSDVTPAGRAVHTTHKGAYSGLRQTYGEMHSFVQSNELTFIVPTWEIYPNDPSNTPEDELITECYQAIGD